MASRYLYVPFKNLRFIDGKYILFKLLIYIMPMKVLDSMMANLVMKIRQEAKIEKVSAKASCSNYYI